MKCTSGKRQFLSEENAETALIESWTKYQHAEGKGPIAVYKCEDCGLYHLTSSGNMNARLKAELDSGKIKRSAEALLWEQKFKSNR